MAVISNEKLFICFFNFVRNSSSYMEIQEKILSPLEKGVKLIGIGKHGSKKLPDELIIEILEELKEEIAQPILTGAFFGALMMKDLEPGYYILEEFLGKGCLNNTQALWNKLCFEAPSYLENIGIKLINKQTLTIEESETLGTFLFSEEPGELFRGMAVSILRIRYEADEEYQGIYNSIRKMIPAKSISKGGSTIQLAEPFDGVEHSWMITPLLARELQKNGYTVVATCGRSSGPKISLNTWDIYKEMQGKFIKDPGDLLGASPEFGWAMDQKDFFPMLDTWVDRRRIIMKRPFLATLEKVLNPLQADILITSVFHIPYLEKMIELALMTGFRAVMVLKRGLEGTLAPSLAKATGILCAVKMPDGSVLTEHIDGMDESFSLHKADTDAVVKNVSAEKNIEHIKKYVSDGATGDLDFDSRVKLSAALYTKGMQWIEQVQKL